MGNINIGDKVKIKEKTDWPASSGTTRLSNAEGNVTAISEEEGFVTVNMEKSDLDWAKGSNFVFRLDGVEKV